MKIFKKVSSSQSGAAELMMVLVAAVIGGIIMMNGSSLITRVQKQNQNTNQTQGAADLKSEIEQLLAIPGNCSANFQVVPAGEATYFTDAIEDATGTPIFNADGGTSATYHNGQLKIVRWSLDDTGPVLDTAPVERKIVTLNIVMQKSGDSTGPKEIVRKIKMIATKVGGPGSAIDSCQAIVGSENDLWVKSLSGTDISNTNSGNVGIGTNSPTSKLHVTGTAPGDGDIHIGADLTLVGTPANSGFTISAGNMGVGQNLTHQGRVGIGLTTPSVAFDVLGNMLITGNKSVTNTTTVGSIISQGITSLGANLNVSGATQLQTLTVNGSTSLGGDSTFRGMSQIDGPLTTSSTVSVNSTSFASAGNDLQISGTLDVLGTLSMSNASVSNQICLGVNCITSFAIQSCPSGTIHRVNADGSLTCTQSSCGTNSYIQGLTGTTSPNCTVLPTASCPNPNEFITTINPVTGAVTCSRVSEQAATPACGPGTFMAGVSNGNPVCRSPALSGASSCPAGTTAAGLNPDGTLSCVAPGVGTPCPAGQLAYGTKSDGSMECRTVLPADVNCANPNEVMTGINSDGTPRCGQITITSGMCPAGNMITSLNPDGSFTCGPGTVVTTCPHPDTSMAGVGGSASPAGCFCNDYEYLWDGANCVSPPSQTTITCSFAGTSTGGAGGAATPAGCFCNTAGQLWNGTACYTPAPSTYSSADLDACTAPIGASCSPVNYSSAICCGYNRLRCNASGIVQLGVACGGGGGGGGCFIAGTQVTMADDSKKAIEKILVGDLIKAYDEETGDAYIAPVTKQLTHEAKWQDLHHFLLSDGTVVTSNDVHPFYVNEEKDWLKASQIYINWMSGLPVTFINEQGLKVSVISIKLERKFVPVYNLHVNGLPQDKKTYWERGHSYFANGILVHNAIHNK